MPPTLQLADHATRDDLRTYLERLLRAGRPEVRLVTRGAVLAVFGCTQAPEGLTDPVPTVLVLRSFALAEPLAPPGSEVDLVAPARSLLDRIARMGVLGRALELPDAEVTAAWAGVLPPTSGWEPAGAVDAASLARVAEEGMTRIAAALPDAPGDAVVRQVRRAVWGGEIAPGLPAAAAFAAEAMGFLGGDGGVGMSATLTWRRLTTGRGEVLVRTFLG
jgi:hypothetical protein